jgi:hypothetical protein
MITQTTRRAGRVRKFAFMCAVSSTWAMINSGAYALDHVQACPVLIDRQHVRNAFVSGEREHLLCLPEKSVSVALHTACLAKVAGLPIVEGCKKKGNADTAIRCDILSRLHEPRESVEMSAVAAASVECVRSQMLFALVP